MIDNHYNRQSLQLNFLSIESRYTTSEVLKAILMTILGSWMANLAMKNKCLGEPSLNLAEVTKLRKSLCAE